MPHTKTHLEEETKQSYTRVIFLMIISVGLLFFTYYQNSDFYLFIEIVVFFAVGTFSHLFFLKRWPKKNLILRKSIIITFDMLCIAVLMYYLEYYGTVFSIMLLWVIMGNGMRFGLNYLYFSILMALVGLLLIYLFSSYWHENLHTIILFAIAVILLPIFYAKLLKRLKYKNEELEQLLKQTEYQSKHDSLTKLPNRKHFELRLNEAIEEDKKFALFFVDLDKFKSINDTLGHLVGDKVLQEVALRLQEVISPHDIAARLGGDEFVVIIKNDILNVKELAHQMTQLLSQPYEQGDITSVSASIGISYYPDDAVDNFLLKKYADIAMYEVKSKGKNSFLEYCTLGAREAEMEFLPLMSINNAT